MPIFDYQCGECFHEWEVTVLSSSDQPLECPKCKGKPYRIVSWSGMYTGEHKKALDRPPPGNRIVVGGTKITSNKK